MKLRMHIAHNPAYKAASFHGLRVMGRTPDECEEFLYELFFGEQKVEGLVEVRAVELEKKLGAFSRQDMTNPKYTATIEVELDQLDFVSEIK